MFSTLDPLTLVAKLIFFQLTEVVPLENLLCTKFKGRSFAEFRNLLPNSKMVILGAGPKLDSDACSKLKYSSFWLNDFGDVKMLKLKLDHDDWSSFFL